MQFLDGLFYVSGAFGYALALTAAGALGLRLTAGRVSQPVVILILCSLFVIFLALHPFPDRATLDCSTGGASPMLTPFESLQGYRVFWAEGRPLADWLQSRWIVAPAMNVMLFMLPGLALAPLTRRWPVALALGLGVTLFNEMTQLTGLYGVYPCAYRTFSVDDLMFNTLGVLLGFGLWHLRHKRRGAPGPSRF